MDIAEPTAFASRRSGAGRVFESFLMGGFEGSSHRRADGSQVDPIDRTSHDAYAAEDYALLAQTGIMTVREALRWHLIEARPGEYDWTSCMTQVRAARAMGVQVIWDLCHYGVPAHLDIWSDAFLDHFARFAAAAATMLRAQSGASGFFCPVNEISYWAWAGGGHASMYPAAPGRGNQLKRQLVRAAIGAVRAVRAVDPDARFIQAEPLINVPSSAASMRASPAHFYQYEANDMIAGHAEPELGGDETCLDIVGANYYHNNQWFSNNVPIPFGHRCHRPLSELLAELHERYGRPLIVSETGAEGRNGAAWLRHVAEEVRIARENGLPVLGLCLYPVMDYPGWTDNRHCRCGLIELDAKWDARRLDRSLMRQVRREQRTGWDTEPQTPQLALSEAR